MSQSPLYIAKKMFGEQDYMYVLTNTFGDDILTLPIHLTPYRDRENLNVGLEQYDTIEEGMEKVRIKWLEFWPSKRSLLKEKVKNPNFY